MPNSLLMQIKRHSADKQAFCEADANYLDVSSPVTPLSPILTRGTTKQVFLFHAISIIKEQCDCAPDLSQNFCLSEILDYV